MSQNYSGITGDKISYVFNYFITPENMQVAIKSIIYSKIDVTKHTTLKKEIKKYAKDRYSIVYVDESVSLHRID